MSLLDRILSTAQWTIIPVEEHTDDLPYATHEAWIALGEDTLHVFQLNTGKTIIEQGSLEALMDGPVGMWLVFLQKYPEWEPDVRLASSGLPDLKTGELGATPEATKAFVQWADDRGLVTHAERLPGVMHDLDYQAALGRQERSRRKPKLRLIRPRQDQQ